MSVLKKRAIAILIDSFILGSIIVLCDTLLQGLGASLGNFDLLLIALMIFKDCIFKNASIGKKIMGIAIYNIKWQPPRFGVLIRRALLMQTIGYLLFCKAMLIDRNFTQLLDWERDTFGTRVIDNKLYKKLSEEAKNMGGDYVKNMNELYM